MRVAKARFSKAAAAVLDGLPLAEVMATHALEELNAARADLKSLDGDLATGPLR